MSQLEKLKEIIEWNCNETNNHHCKVVARIAETNHGEALIIYPETNNRGEYLKISGYDSVLRECFGKESSEEWDIIVSNVNPDNGKIVVREL